MSTILQQTLLFTDIQLFINELRNSKADDAFLIIKIDGTENFIQFSGTSEVVQMDFPMITENQRTYEMRIKAYGKKHELEIVENLGTDGSRFLDFDLSGSASLIATQIVTAFSDIFSVDSDRMLQFKFNGFNNPSNS